jgi:hypothetical protein
VTVILKLGHPQMILVIKHDTLNTILCKQYSEHADTLWDEKVDGRWLLEATIDIGGDLDEMGITKKMRKRKIIEARDAWLKEFR